MIDFPLALTYDDIMMVPQHSTITSRKKPSLKTFLGGIEFEIPIVAAPMNTVTEREMAQALGEIGASSVLHRYLSIPELIDNFLTIGIESPWIAVGATGDFLERAQELAKYGANKFCVDVANGHSDICVDAVKTLRKKLEGAVLMAGNVCTKEGARNLVLAGADVIRVGIGPGSMCTTRLVTGFGVPQVTAIQEIHSLRTFTFPCEFSLIADGGIRNSGDIVKALALGADAVMIGGLLAGTDESPGKTERDSEGRLYKYYHGMASVEGRQEWFEKEAVSYVPEGSSTKVCHRGEAKKIIRQLANSVKVGMSFANARNLEELRKNAQFVRITDNGRREANPNMKMFGGKK